jgi:hypothetical protein
MKIGKNIYMIFHSVYSVQFPFFVSISDIQLFGLREREEVSGYPPVASLHWGLFTFRPAVCEETQGFTGDQLQRAMV